MTSNPEMVEIVAKALCQRTRGITECGVNYHCSGNATICHLWRAHIGDATTALQALSPHYVERPVWSDTVPTVEGWYWFRRDEDHWQVVFRVFPYKGDLAIKYRAAPTLLDEMQGQWAPCPAPMEVK